MRTRRQGQSRGTRGTEEGKPAKSVLMVKQQSMKEVPSRSLRTRKQQKQVNRKRAAEDSNPEAGQQQAAESSKRSKRSEREANAAPHQEQANSIQLLSPNFHASAIAENQEQAPSSAQQDQKVNCAQPNSQECSQSPGRPQSIHLVNSPLPHHLVVHEEDGSAQPAAATDQEPTGTCFQPGHPSHLSMALSALSMDVTMSGNEQGYAPSTSSAVAGAPFGRQQQFQELFAAISAACKDSIGRSIYISGLPGTGKSHTVRTVIKALQNQCHSNPISSISISCFGLKEPGQIHATVLEQCARLHGNDSVAESAAALSPEQAQTKLVSYLQNLGKSQAKTGSKKHASAKGRMLVLVLDEVDRLLGARTGIDDLTKLFSLPHNTGVRLCVIALANSIDITERCLPELKLRGCTPLFMPFGAYLRVQLLAVLTAKVASLPWPVFDMAALELAARKVAASTGDMRKALQACRVALRILGEQCGATLPTVQATSPALSPSRVCSPAPASPVRGRTAALHIASPARSPGLLPQELVMSPSRENCTSPGRARLPPRSPASTALLRPSGASAQPHSSALLPAGVARLVGVKEMTAALSRVMYQSSAAASAVAAVRALPPQQQVCLLAVASAAASAAATAAAETAADAAAAEHGLTCSAYRAKYYWGPASAKKQPAKLSNPFAAAPAVTPGKGKASHHHTLSGVSPTAVTGTAQATPSRSLMAGDAARAVPVAAAYEQYRALCGTMFQQPVSEAEFWGMQQLLSHVGLVSCSQAGVGGSARKVARGTTGGTLLLKVSMRDIHTALKENAVFKKVLANLPHL